LEDTVIQTYLRCPLTSISRSIFLSRCVDQGDPSLSLFLGVLIPVMGKGDISFPQGLVKSVQTTDMYPHIDTSVSNVRSRHLSNGGSAAVMLSSSSASLISDYRPLPPVSNGLIYVHGGGVKHANGVIPVQDVQRRSLIEKKFKDKGVPGDRWHPKEGRIRGYVVLAILLLANLINYMDRYTIAGTVS